MKKTLIIALLSLCISMVTFSQSHDEAKRWVQELSSSRYYGRGYVKNGCNKAAKYLAKEMRSLGLKSFGRSYYQTFDIAVNTFPSRMHVSIDGKVLEPGIDYIIHPASHSMKGTFTPMFLPDSIGDSLTMPIPPNSIPIWSTKNKQRFYESKAEQDAIYIGDRCAWSVARQQKPFCRLMIWDGIIDSQSANIHIDYKATFKKNYTIRNVIGFIPGSVCPDSMIVFTAHYDHLGCIGRNTYYPGASDNATGTAMVLDLARYYVQNPHKAYYTMVFVLLAGEEAGICGAKHNTENPIWDFDKTRFLVNLDMVGSGSEGITIVNSTEFPHAFQDLCDNNKRKSLLPKISPRGPSCNSDHCPYYENGIPSFFIYTNGPEGSEYHSITDTYDKVKFTGYKALFILLTDFVKQIEKTTYDR